VPGAFSVEESAALGLSDGDGETEAAGDVVVVGEVVGLALALGVADTDGEVAGEGDVAVDVVVVLVVGLQETAAIETLAAITRLYSKNFFINIIKA